MPYRATPADGVAWITGASSGIGRTVALELARRGFKVVASARRVDELAKLVAEAPDRIVSYPLDVADRAASDRAPTDIEAAHGPIALAFFNAGVAVAARDGLFDADALRATFAVNVFGVADGVAALLPLMAARRKGQIAINASLAGYGGLPRIAAYGASKAALINMAESLKFDCDRNNINVQIVNPGFVDTPMTKNNSAMPFLMTMEDAARVIVDGFARGGFEITFPWLFSRIMKLIRLMPYPLYFRAIAFGWNRSAK